MEAAPKKGLGAGAPSHRREYRKFRKPAKPNPQVSCKFFMTPDGCKFGEKCRFGHDQRIDNVEGIENLSLEEKPSSSVGIFYPPVVTQPQKAAIPPILKLTKAELGSEQQKNLRDAEIAFFKKRYRHCKIENNETGTTISFKYETTDPEWIFELKTIHFSIHLQYSHPIEPPFAFLPEESNNCIPEIAREYISQIVNEAFKEKYELFAKRDAFENIGKNLIKWLDHSLFEIFVAGLKQTKFTIQAEAIGMKLYMPKKAAEPVTEKQEERISEENESQNQKNNENSKSEAENNKGTDEKSPFIPVDHLPIDVVLNWKNLSGNVGTIKPVCLKIITKCLRCSTERDTEKINYGEHHKSWCHECHALIELSIATIRFRGNIDECFGEDRQIAASIPKPKKLVETRSHIQEGQSLPDLGACEHYKKSYRWFRFPCCGKLYPCDTCHEKATNGEHEMKVANRIVCGHCSKEQAFVKNQPCAGCGEGTTRKKTSFWEGGKGCRDPTRMNKNDAHKFVNSKKKTVPKSKMFHIWVLIKRSSSRPTSPRFSDERKKDESSSESDDADDNNHGNAIGGANQEQNAVIDSLSVVDNKH
ncbi:unnamed protein product [Caenorhabditis bovis]|uniref:C3H1-type domain-containing protein n=1 Tax=Caenorhabditis bovis TaxID=2654633 RepID=A0A8S1FBR0_9PELO|nr:unnamed protein product [Caenorhabditis bovis]